MHKHIGIGIIVIILIGAVGFIFIRRQQKEDMALVESVTTGATDALVTAETADTDVVPEEISGLTIEEEEALFANDEDRDGISNTQEDLIGTSDTAFDTDNDGLSDQLEIDVTKTDPTNPDTDGDGFSDGVEILEGFNPLGDGRLAT